MPAILSDVQVVDQMTTGLIFKNMITKMQSQRWAIDKMVLALPIIILNLLSSSVIAQEPDSSSALFHMREAERNFAKESIMYGRNASFVKNFAEESVIFTDKWMTNGRQFWKKQSYGKWLISLEMINTDKFKTGSGD